MVRSLISSSRSPHALGHPRLHLELAPLDVGRKLVSVRAVESAQRRGEAALRRDRQLLDRQVLGGLLDSAQQLVLILDARILRAHDAEHDDWAWTGHVAKGREIPLALDVLPFDQE